MVALCYSSTVPHTHVPTIIRDMCLLFELICAHKNPRTTLRDWRYEDHYFISAYVLVLLTICFQNAIILRILGSRWRFEDFLAFSLFSRSQVELRIQSEKGITISSSLFINEVEKFEGWSSIYIKGGGGGEAGEIPILHWFIYFYKNKTIMAWTQRHTHRTLPQHVLCSHYCKQCSQYCNVKLLVCSLVRLSGKVGVTGRCLPFFPRVHALMFYRVQATAFP